MSKREYSDMDIQLELKDRLDFTYVVQATLVNFKKAIFNKSVTKTFLDKLMWDFITDIPTSWYDEQFLIDARSSFITSTIDCRPVWGGAKLSEETCLKHGYEITKQHTELNPFVLKNAIINLLHRRDMLVRKKKIEYTTGKNLKYLTLDDLPDSKEDYEDEDLLNMPVGDKQLKDEIDAMEDLKSEEM